MRGSIYKAMTEKRTGQDKRVNIKLTVNFGTRDISNLGFTEDISASGIFLKTARVYPVGTNLKIEITTDDGEIIRILGYVHWSKEVPPNLVWTVNDAGMGIQIIRFVCGQDIYFRLLKE
ncbi:MAG: pilus assembly protein PilZ [Desulfuromonas sp.]|nr:MAG: pilus assembly protein PilZ [Desulfuromonas sp.]